MLDIVSNNFTVNIDKKGEVVSNSFILNINKGVSDNVFSEVSLITNKNIKKGIPTRVAIRLKSHKDINKQKICVALALSKDSFVQNIQFEKGSVLTDYRKSVSEISKKSANISINVDKISSSVSNIESDYIRSSDIEQLDDRWTAKFKDGYTQGIVEMTKDGISVSSSNSKTETKMTANGFYIQKNKSNVFSVDNNGLRMNGEFEFTTDVNRVWLGETTTKDSIHLKSTEGAYRCYNPNARHPVTNAIEPRSVYYTDRGISTSRDGNKNSSAILDIHNVWYKGQSQAKGMTMYSDNGIVGLVSRQNVVQISPRWDYAGNNTFSFTVRDDNDATKTDGRIRYGSHVNGWHTSIRMGKNRNTGVWVEKVESDGTYARGKLEVGEVSFGNDDTITYDDSKNQFLFNVDGGGKGKQFKIGVEGARANDSTSESCQTILTSPDGDHWLRLKNDATATWSGKSITLSVQEQDIIDSTKQELNVDTVGLLKDISVYQYQTQEDTFIPRVGLLNSEVPATLQENGQLDIYAIQGVLWDICKKQQEQIEKMQIMINMLASKGS